MASTAAVVRLAGYAELEARLADLCGLLADAVDSGASLGFLPPLKQREAADYWREVLDAQNRLVWIAEADRQIVGSVQLDLCTKANGSHRAEVQKLMVGSEWRRQGIGVALMAAVEREAVRHRRTLLVLDTRRGDPSEALYRSLGYTEAGVIPGYARSSNGELHDTVFFYRTLA